MAEKSNPKTDAMRAVREAQYLASRKQRETPAAKKPQSSPESQSDPSVDATTKKPKRRRQP